MSKETIFLFAIKLKRKVFKAPGDKTTLSRDIDSNQNKNSSFSSKKIPDVENPRYKKEKEYM